MLIIDEYGNVGNVAKSLFLKDLYKKKDYRLYGRMTDSMYLLTIITLL